MGYDSRARTITGLLSSHNSERDCEHGALWWELEQRAAAIASEPRYADLMATLPLDDDERPEWTADDWRAGRPCSYGDRHAHRLISAPPPVRDGVT